MHENEISREIVDTAFHIHSTLGPGLLESVYEEIMYYELTKKEIKGRSSKGVTGLLGWS